MPLITQGKTNWKFLLIVFILVIIVGVVSLWYVKRLEQPYQPVEIKKSETADWKIYSNEEYGFKMKYPDNFKISSDMYQNGVVTFIPKDEEFTPGVNIPTYLISIGKISSPLFGQQLKDFLTNYVIFDPSGMHPKSFNEFGERKIGNNSFYFIKTGLFEGQLTLSYFLSSPKGVFSFNLLSSKVDWTNPNLDIEKDQGHLYLNQMLSTFKFTNVTSQATCIPNWQCGWGPCVNGAQSMTAIDSNDCGLSPTGISIACPALARMCK